MATGDQNDFVGRLKAVLPTGWFPDVAPILTGLLTGCANAWAYCYALQAFVRLQARRLTASGVFLDMIAADFFGTTGDSLNRLIIKRRVNESDGLLSARIGKELFREKGTRAGLIAALTDLTGRAPAVFEPAYPLDTGGYSAAGMAYGGLIWISARASSATWLDASGTLQTAAPGVARPQFTGGVLTGVISEAAATNAIPNPRCEGAITGTPGTAPTNGWLIAPQPGLSSSVIGSGYQNGIPYIDVRFFGTTTSSSSSRVYFVTQTANPIAASFGQTWTSSAYANLTAGSFANVSAQQLMVDEYNSATALIGHASAIAIGSASLSAQRYSYTVNLTQPTVNAIRTEIAFVINTGLAVDFTVRIGAPQCEQGSAATSVILPPVGVPGASSRAADSLSNAARVMGEGYGAAGGYGSLMLPFQFFLTAYRPTGQGVANVAGYGDIGAGLTAMPGGYGVGAVEYVTPSMFAPQVADADILAVINDVRPVASIAWTRLSGGSAGNVVVLGAPAPVAGGGSGSSGNSGGIISVGGGGAATPPVTPPTPPTTPAANVLPGGSANPPAPSAISGSFAVAGWTYQTYNGVAYIRMLPANYDPTKRYPLLVFLHTDDDGIAYYNGGISADQSYGVASKFQQYFQSTAFQRNFPCIFIAPLLDQRAQTSDGQINFGGYGNSLAGHQAVTALVKYMLTQYPIDAARIYSAGASMGGTGTVVNLILDNTINGSEEANVYAAGLALSPVDYDAASLVGGNYVVSSAVVTQIQAGVPLGLIHGASDTDQPATRFSLPLYNQLGGTGGNANGMAWSRAGTSNTYLLIDPALGHDTWDTYLSGNDLLTYFGWLFSHTSSGVSAAAITASPSGSFITAGVAGASIITTTSGGTVTDGSGNVWALLSTGYLTENGVQNSDSAGTNGLTVVGGVIWARDGGSGTWYTFSGGYFTSQGTATPPSSGGSVASTGSLTDAQGNIYTINASGQVAVNGIADTTTSSVAEVAYVNGAMSYKNSVGNWLTHTAPGKTWTPATNPLGGAVAASGSNFSVSGGNVYTPSGTRFLARAINVTDAQLGNASAILALYPAGVGGLNFVRVACFSYQAPSAYAAFVTAMNNAGVIVALENHQNFNADGSSAGNYGGGQGYCNTGSILQTELNWYAALATYYKNNPNVWLMTTNEPSVNPSVAALSTWHDAIIGTIRNAGNNSIIMVDVNNPYTWGSGAMTASVYAKYHNLVWDPHFYGWMFSDSGTLGQSPGYSTNAATIAAQIRQGVQLLQTIQSADGIMPCIVGEYGNSTSGQGIDANGTLVITAVEASVGAVTSGCAAWLYDDLGTSFDDQLQHGGVLTSYGQTVKNWFATFTS